MPCKKDMLMVFPHTPHPQVSSLGDYLLSFKNPLEGIDLTSESSTKCKMCISKTAYRPSFFTFLLAVVFPVENTIFSKEII